jgi:hypothetical protein
MKKAVMLGLCFIVLAMFVSAAYALESSIQPTGLVLYKQGKALDGYTLVTHNSSNRAFLLDMEGNIVHKWQMKYTAGLFAMLLPNGNLLAGGSAPPKEKPVNFGGASGYVTEYDWNGNVVWEWKELSDRYIQHHCFDRLPNGNTLILGWEYKSYEEAVAKGRDPKSLNPDGYDNHGQIIKGIWPDYVKEVTPDKKVVWEWHVWDHLGTGPKQFNINYILPEAAEYMHGPDWTHFNTSTYDPKTDKIVLNSRNFGEIYVINHQTGEMEQRWGNPCAYGQGKCPKFVDDGDTKLFGSHDASIEEDGNFMVFDNGWYRPQGERSRVLEIDRSGKIVWQWAASMPHTFSSRYQGAVQKLPNGNYFITSSGSGHLIEVTGTEKPEIVWEWFSPLFNDKPQCFARDTDMRPGTELVMNNTIHRAYRYGKDYPAFQGKDLSKKELFVPGGCFELWKLYGEWEAKQKAAAPAK